MDTSYLRKQGIIFALLFVATIFVANFLTGNIGTVQFDQNGPWMIPVWPESLSPIGTVYSTSGTIAAGLSFTLRDIVQRRLGVRVAWFTILAGALASALVDPRLAIASAGAFLLAETLDLIVYTPLQRNHLIWASVLSNIVGFVADSIVFLMIAFGTMAFWEGQVICKAWMTLLALPLVIWIRKRDDERGIVAYDDRDKALNVQLAKSRA